MLTPTELAGGLWTELPSATTVPHRHPLHYKPAFPNAPFVPLPGISGSAFTINVPHRYPLYYNPAFPNAPFVPLPGISGSAFTITVPHRHPYN